MNMPPYNVRAIPMDTALTNEEIALPGISLAVNTDGTLAGVTIKFDSATYDPIPLNLFKNPHFYSFEKLYVTFTAQAGKTLYLLVGRGNLRAERV